MLNRKTYFLMFFLNRKSISFKTENRRMPSIKASI